MAKVLLGVTGSVAAIRTPALYQALRRTGHEVKVVATAASLYFFDPAELISPEAQDAAQNPGVLVRDADEWPGRDDRRRYQRDDPVLHIELRRWADLLLIAPLDANTLAKLAAGLADNCLTCVWRAWDPARPVVLAPAMNTFMWDHPLTTHHFRQLASCATSAALPPGSDRDAVIDWINQTCPTLRVVPPQSKRLACGDIGMGALAELDTVVAAVTDLLSPGRLV